MNNDKFLLDITFLFPNTMSTYGDSGNILSLEKRCQWRGIGVNIHFSDIYDSIYSSDIYFWGGGQDRAQEIVSSNFSRQKIDFLGREVENNKLFLLICGSYQLMGKYYIDSNNNKIPGLGILDVYTQSSSKRMIGNTIIESNKKLSIGVNTIVGFENHSGKTFLEKNVEPFGYVKYGFGNNGLDKTEGALYKNVIACYQHGPLLPKNPHLTDYIILKALENKYGLSVNLQELDDSLELKAFNTLLNRL
ncbi:MAG: type 1 glutamine amidotransferase, partial [Desulfurella sp.]